MAFGAEISNILRHGFNVQKLVVQNDGSKLAAAASDSLGKTAQNSSLVGGALANVTTAYGREQLQLSKAAIERAGNAINAAADDASFASAVGIVVTVDGAQQLGRDAAAGTRAAIAAARKAAVGAGDASVDSALMSSFVVDAGVQYAGDKVSQGAAALSLAGRQMAFDTRTATGHGVASLGGKLMNIGKEIKPDGARPLV